MIGKSLSDVLQTEIDKVYGPESGEQTGKILIPAFLSDFRNVLSKSDAGKNVTEEYMTEDKRIHLILKGQRRFGAGGMEMWASSCLFNDNELLMDEVRF